jgi:hypothetical protein
MANESFTAPFPVANEQSTIWRYMDFTKFVSLLNKRSLFLCRADNLEDQFEGSSALSDIEAWKMDFYREKILEGKWGYEKMQRYIDERSKKLEELKQSTYISSWRMSEHESAAMWKIYAQTNEAVAIKSSVERLRKSLPDINALLIGEVKYIDYKKESIAGKIHTDRFFYKRKSFEYEEEIRVVLDQNDKNHLNKRVVRTEGGVYIKTKIDILINKIYIAPNSPKWFQELVDKVANLYGINKKAKRTSLEDKALY